MEISKDVTNPKVFFNNISAVKNLVPKKGKFTVPSFDLTLYKDNETVSFDKNDIEGAFKFAGACDYDELKKFHLSFRTSFEEEGFRLRASSFSFSEDDTFEISIEGKNRTTVEKIFQEFQTTFPECKQFVARIAEDEKKREDREKKEREKEAKIRKCSYILRNLNTLQVRMMAPLKDEKEVQAFLFPILKSHFDDLEDEFHLPKYGDIEYKPDFGVPSLKHLIEVKFLSKRTTSKDVQKEITDDSVGYLRNSNQYKTMTVFIYNSEVIPVSDRFTKDIESLKGIREVIIVPGVNPI